MVKQLPCVPMGCSACCRETTMPLTISEAKRLSRRTGMAVETFTWEHNGVLTLLNDETTRACVFLLIWIVFRLRRLWFVGTVIEDLL